MKIEIDTDDLDILESYDSYDEEYKNSKVQGHRRWGRMSWLYPGEIIIQISNKSATVIKEAIKIEYEQQKEKTNNN